MNATELRGSGPNGGRPADRPEVRTEAGRARVRRLLIQTALVVATLLPTGGILVAIELDHRVTVAEETAETRDLLRLANRTTEALIERTNVMLASLEARVRAVGPAPGDVPEALLERWRTATEHYLALARVGNDGQILQLSSELPAPLAAAAGPMVMRRLSPDQHSVILTIPGTAPGNCYIVIARTILTADGMPDGAFMAILDPLSLKQFYQNLSFGPGGAAFLLDRHGDVIAGTGPSLVSAGMPPRWGVEATALPLDSPPVALSAAPGHGDWIALARPVAGAPLWILMVRDSSPAFGAWRTRAFTIGVLGGVPVMVACGLAVAALEQSRTLKRQSRTFADQAGTLAATLESVDDAIIAFDADGCITLANRSAARLLKRMDPGPDAGGSPPDAGLTASALVGHRLSSFALRWRTVAEAASTDPRADRTGADLVDDLVRRACAGERVGPLEIAALTEHGGDPIRLLATFRAIPGVDGPPSGAVLVLHDRTGERAIEEKLRHSEKMQAIGQLTGGVAHDFNNLLLVILGGAEELRERLGHDPQGRRTAALITQAAERGAGLTRRLLAFSRRQTLAPRVVAMAALLEDCLPLLTRTAGASVSIALKVDKDVWNTRIDPEQLVVGLVNLVANARDAMPGGGRILIEVTNETQGPRDGALSGGEYVTLRISDTGTGMTADVRTRAIEPFFSTKGPGAGTGLGLSMVYGFVRQSGGRMRIESQPGSGTRVSLMLPRARGAATITEAASGECPTGSERVLLMEPDPLVAGRVSDLLAGLGYRVEVAPDPADALDRLVAGTPFDLLVTDADLPDGLDGVGLVRLARARQPNLAILLTTASAPEGDVRQTDAGPLILLAKPWRREDLARQLRAALSARA